MRTDSGPSRGLGSGAVGDAVRAASQAVSRSKTKKKVPAYRVRPNPDTRDAGGMKRAEKYKRSEEYAQDVRAAYGAASPKQRREIVRLAETGGSIPYRTEVGRYHHRSREQVIAYREHTRRIAQQRAAEAFHRNPSGRGDIHNDMPLARKFIKEQGYDTVDLTSGLGRLAAAHALYGPSEGGKVKTHGAAGAKDVLGSINLITNPDNILAKFADYAGKQIELSQKASGPLSVLGRLGMSPKTVGHLGRDLIDIPAQAVPSAWLTGRAIVKAIGGDTSEAEMQLEGLKQIVEDPGKALGEHPLLVPLLAKGGLSVAGRTAGTTLRTVGRLPKVKDTKVGKTASRIASTDREDLVLRSTGERIGQRYSKDLSRKATQILTDKARLRMERGENPVAAKSARRLEEHNLRVAVNEQVGLTEATRRYNRERTRQLLGHALPRHGAAKELAPFIYDATVRTPHSVRSDLHARLKQLQDESSSLSHADDIRLNRNMQTQIQNLLDNEKLLANPERAFRGARALALQQHAVDKALVEKGHLLTEQARKARLIPYAVRWMGAKYDSEKRLTSAGERMKAAEQRLTQAEKDLTQARKKLNSTQTREGRKRARVEVQVAHVDQKAVRDEPAVRATHRVHAQNYRKVSSLKRQLEAEKDPLVREKLEKELQQARDATAASRAAHQTARATAHERITQDKAGKIPGLGTKPAQALAGLERMRADVKLAEHRHAAAKKEMEVAKAHLKDVKVPKNQRTFIPGLVDKDGNPLRSDVIERHMRDSDVNPESVGFMTHRMGTPVGFRSAHGRPQYEARFTRTGESYRKGLYEANFKALAESLIRSQGILDAVAGRQALIDRFGVRGVNGEYFRNLNSAQRAASHLHAKDPHSVEMVPYMIADPRLDVARLEAFKSGMDPHVIDEFLDEITSPVHEMAPGLAASPTMLERLGVKTFDPRMGEQVPSANYVLIPKVVAEQIKAHDDVLSKVALDRGLNAYTQRWRSAILHYTSVWKWSFGNVAEMLFRLAVAGARPTDVRLGRRVMNSVLQGLGGDAEKMAHVRNMLLTGGHFEGTQGLWVRDYLRDDKASVWKAMHELSKKPGMSQVVGVMRAWKALALKANRIAEETADYAAIGKLARNDLQGLQEFNQSFRNAIYANEKAVQQIAKGLLETPEQIRYARYVQQTIGKYVNLSPSARKFISTYTVFGAWYGNAMKFVFMTMPIEHPILAALSGLIYKATEEERKQTGDVSYGDGKPDYLQGTVAYNGHLHPWHRFVPFGALDDFPSNAADQVLTQFGPFLDAFAGTNFTHKEMKTSKGDDPEPLLRLAMAGYFTLEGMTPFAPDIRRIVEKGGTPYFESTIFAPKTKPGTQRKSRTEVVRSIVEPGYQLKGGADRQKGGATDIPSAIPIGIPSDIPIP